MADGADNPSVVRPSALPTREMTALSSGELLGRVAMLAGELQHLRVHYERLDPGRRSSRPHHHTAREECVYVVAGEVELMLGETSRSMEAGDFVALPAGPPAHTLRNVGDGEAELLVFSASPGPDEVVYAEDSRVAPSTG